MHPARPPVLSGPRLWAGPEGREESGEFWPHHPPVCLVTLGGTTDAAQPASNNAKVAGTSPPLARIPWNQARETPRASLNGGGPPERGARA